MNNIQFAIASIVDANTGNGLVHDSHRIDYGAAASHGREIRSKSVLALLQRVAAGFYALLKPIREHLAARRNLRKIAALNDHLLEDIGLSRGDVIALQLGQVDVSQLEAKRFARHTARNARRSAVVSKIGNGVERNAFNEAVFARAKCA